MGEIVIVYNNRAYDEVRLVINVEAIEMPPKNGSEVFMPGKVTYSFTLPDSTKVETTREPYRFIYDDKMYFVFHTI